MGTIEDWYYINLTGDTHPMHVHLFTFQVVGRVPFDVDRYIAAAGQLQDGVPGGTNPWPFATGPLTPAEPTERGFKDTVKVNPGTFTVIRGRFDLPNRHLSTPDLRPPLPHPRTRRQRHDATIHRRSVAASEDVKDQRHKSS